MNLFRLAAFATVTNTVGKIGTKTRAVERKLRNACTLKAGEQPTARVLNGADGIVNASNCITGRDVGNLQPHLYSPPDPFTESIKQNQAQIPKIAGKSRENQVLIRNGCSNH